MVLFLLAWSLVGLFFLALHFLDVWARSDQQLRVANWLGQRLPFRWLPTWANNRLARWMWHVPGFDAVPRSQVRP